ncbi:hypothetical protein IAU60_001818 [Kwoniella sp. DSM 27419]
MSSSTHRLNPPSSAHGHASPQSSRSVNSNASSPQQRSSLSSPRNSPRSGIGGNLDMESVLKHHGGDVRKALEGILIERNNLQAQNTQLWKLIEKQRAQCAGLASDNERLRQDREMANERLLDEGREAVVNGKRIANSSSATGLSAKPEPPVIRRHNSDRDNTPTKASVLKEAVLNTSAPSSPAQGQTLNGLLPSPIPDRKSRRDSKMAFPPEVASYMSLTNSPQGHAQSTPQIASSRSYNTLSPASQYSASPGIDIRDEHGIVPPASSRALAITTQAAYSAPRNDKPSSLVKGLARIPSLKSPIDDGESSKFPQSVAEHTPSGFPLDEPVRISVDSAATRRSQESTPRPSLEPTEAGVSAVSIAPTLDPAPRMTPLLLSYSRLSIPTSTVYPNSSGRDVLCFIVSVTARAPNSQPVTWSVAKLFSAFVDLDARLKAKNGKGRKEWKAMTASLPEGKAWKDFAPSKIDHRKTALEAYLQSLLLAPLSDKSDLCQFLNTDHVRNKAESVRKEGYLTKKGKNFGGWKTRFFVLDGPVMEYFESRGGPPLGSITITNAQIGRQNRPADTTEERNFRHAFLIIETTRKGMNRHVLCAESDQERDSWIELLVKHVDPEPAVASQPTVPALLEPEVTRKRSLSRSKARDVIVTAAQPMKTSTTDAKFGGAPSPSLINSLESQRTMPSSQSTSSQASNPSISTSSSGMPQTPTQASSLSSDHPSLSVPSSSSHGSAPMTMVPSVSTDQLSHSASTRSDPTPKTSKRQSSAPGRSAFTPAYLSSLSAQGLNAPPGLHSDKDRDRKAKSRGFWGFGKTPEKVSRPVFGVPLTESLAVASVANLPAIVFRTIEWLEAKKAEHEEGIYRLSGSSAVIKGLKDRFDTEGDVNLVAQDDHWDPHAIAGLLKTFLRDLPTSLLTRELHSRFLAVMDLIEASARVAELSRLVSELPPPNYALLRALTAHLILIVRNSQLNKMTLRNIAIVFSPTLGIPAGIFSELVSHFGAIFDDESDDAVVDPPLQGSLSAEEVEATIKRKRNSMLYQAGGVDAMLGLKGRALDPAADESADDMSNDDAESDSHSVPSSDHHSTEQRPTPQDQHEGQHAEAMSANNSGVTARMPEMPVSPRRERFIM